MEGGLQIRRGHGLVNRWNKAMAIGLRHNHNISFIAMNCKSLAIIFYLTDYATKVEDPLWKRAVVVQEQLEALGDETRQDPANHHQGTTDVESRENRTRRFLMKVAGGVHG